MYCEGCTERSTVEGGRALEYKEYVCDGAQMQASQRDGMIAMIEGDLQRFASLVAPNPWRRIWEGVDRRNVRGAGRTWENVAGGERGADERDERGREMEGGQLVRAKRGSYLGPTERYRTN